MSTAANHKLASGASEVAWATLVELSRDASGRETCRLSIRIPDDWEYVRGHFPQVAVVPGAALLIEVVRARVHALWPAIGEPRAVRRLKFKRVVSPGDALELELERRDPAGDGPRVRFQLTRAGEPCCTGELRFAGGAS
ncbi:MAG: hypothetical protein H6713_24070 [Myxococcales bacterium]|nr:hypothetical protein [Myxococcales bacterium]MCB9753044.1 hypothetical protein [Myxococcales bacterium]